MSVEHSGQRSTCLLINTYSVASKSFSKETALFQSYSRPAIQTKSRRYFFTIRLNQYKSVSRTAIDTARNERAQRGVPRFPLHIVKQSGNKRSNMVCQHFWQR